MYFKESVWYQPHNYFEKEDSRESWRNLYRNSQKFSTVVLRWDWFWLCARVFWSLYFLIHREYLRIPGSLSALYLVRIGFMHPSRDKLLLLAVFWNLSVPLRIFWESPGIPGKLLEDLRFKLDTIWYSHKKLVHVFRL